MRRFWNRVGRMLLVSGVIAGLSACDKQPSEPRTAAPDSPAAQASASGAEIYTAVNVVNQMQEIVDGTQNPALFNTPGVGSLSQADQFLHGKLEHFRATVSKMDRIPGLRRAAGDTVLYDAQWTDILGIRHHERVVYNDATGKAVIYVVASHPTGFFGVLRDSTKLNLDLHFTVTDTSDDIVESAYNRKDYRADHHLRYEEGSMSLDPYTPRTKPTGGVLTGKQVFASGQDSSEISTRFEVHAGLGGSWEMHVRFANGKRYDETVTFTANGTGTFVKSFPDGRREAGTFDSDGSDHQTSYTKTTTFPAGANPRSVYESATFTINPADSSATGTFVGEWRFADGQVRRTEAQITRTVANGYERLTLTQTNSDGTGGTLTLQAGATGATLTGSWIDEARRYVLIDGTLHPDKSADLHLTVYASKQAYDSGAAAIFEATLHFNPDGSGAGRVTSSGTASDFAFGANGEANR